MQGYLKPFALIFYISHLQFTMLLLQLIKGSVHVIYSVFNSALLETILPKKIPRLTSYHYQEGYSYFELIFNTTFMPLVPFYNICPPTRLRCRNVQPSQDTSYLLITALHVEHTTIKN